MLFQLENVTKTYGPVTALDNLTLSVPTGAIGLLGPNGSGKTTLIRTLLGLISINNGSGEILGMDFRRRQLDIRTAVGFAPEDECLFPLVAGIEFVAYAGELVGMPHRDAMQRAHEVLDYVGLGEARYRNVESYSTGMKQRLKLASAIIHDPKLLILDEPTNGMDPAGRDELLNLARDLSRNKGMSLLFSSHLLPDVESVCDYIVVLGGGKLLTKGSISISNKFTNCLRGAAQGRSGVVHQPACSAGLHNPIARRRYARRTTSRRAFAAGALGSGRRRAAANPPSAGANQLARRSLSQGRGAAIMSIVDQGYQHWNGEFSSHAWRWLAIARHGVRVGLKNRAVRRILFVAWTPALALAALLCVWGMMEQKSDLVKPLMPLLRVFGDRVVADPQHYRVEVWTIGFSYFMNIELFFSMILVLLVGPNLISQDLRFNALPLYFSRPLRRIDYFLGKLGVVGAFLGMVMIAPALIAYVLGLLFSLDITIIRDTLPILIGAVFYGFVIVVSAGTLVLALSSLSRNSRYITLMWLAVWFVSGIVASMLVGIEQHQRIRDHYRESRNQAFNAPDRVDVEATPDHFEEEEARAEMTDWRPLISYAENLRRVGRQLMGSRAAWESLSQLQPPDRQWMFRARFMDPQYPWYWSAGVLAGLFGISAWILNRRIRSLDRLR